MRYLLFLLALISFSPVNAQLQKDLIAAFSFDGNLDDSSSSDIALKNYGSVFGLDRNNQVGKAIDFNGSGYTSVMDSTVKTNLPITVSYWMKLNTVSDVHVIFRTDNVQNNHYGVWMNNLPGGGMTLSIGGGKGIANSTNQRYFTTDTAVKKIVAGQWHHVVGIIRDYNDMEIYIDCDKVSGTYHGTGDTVVRYSSTGDFRIGGATSYVGNDANINGSLDDFFMWNRALSSQEVNELCANGLNFCNDIKQGLIADFSFNGDLNDSSVSNISLTNYGSTFGLDRNDEVGSAIDFNKTGYVSVMDSVVKTDLPITVSYWMKLNSISDVNVIFRTDNVQNNHYGVWMNNLPNGGMTLSIGGGKGIANSTNQRYFTTNPTVKKIDPGIWYHIVGIVRAYDDMEIYIDCNKISGTYHGTGDTVVRYSSTGDFRIGGATSYLGDDLNIDGSIDEFNFWNRALCPSEINSICKDELSVSLVNDELKKSKKLVKIVDVMGRETLPIKNTILIYIYDDGSSKKVFLFQ